MAGCRSLGQTFFVFRIRVHFPTAKPLHSKAQRQRSGVAAKRRAGLLAAAQSPYGEGVTQKQVPCA